MSFAATARPGVEAMVSGDLMHKEDPIASRIMRKREQEMVRRSQILNPRRRNMGVEHAVLDRQVAEKKAYKEAQAAEEAEHVRTQTLQRNVLQSMEEKKHELMRERHKAAIEYSMTHLNKGARREYALSDHKTCMEEPDPGPNLENVGMIAMLNFVGQDDTRERKKAEQQMINGWLQEQMREKEDRRAVLLREKEQHHEDTLLANAARAACEATEREEARQEKCEEAEENLRIAGVHRARRQSQKDREAKDRQLHAEAIRNDDRMTEAHDYKISETGKLLDFKRMSQGEQQEHYDGRALQILEKQAQKQADAEEEARYADGIHKGMHVLHALEQEKQRQMRERAKQQVAFNQTLAAAKRASDLQEKRVYKSFEM
jgi:hypothetical protein